MTSSERDELRTHWHKQRTHVTLVAYSEQVFKHLEYMHAPDYAILFEESACAQVIHVISLCMWLGRFSPYLAAINVMAAFMRAERDANAKIIEKVLATYQPSIIH